MCLELYIQILKKPREKIKCFETGHPGFHPEFHPEFDFRGTTHIPPTATNLPPRTGEKIGTGGQIRRS